MSRDTSTITRSNFSSQVMNTNNDTVAALSSSPVTMVAAAISDSTTIPANSSIVLISAVVTTTLESNQHLYNSTGYLGEQDELEYSILAAFSDMQTVFLACISTLLPLIIAVAIAFGVRRAWRKYRHKRNGMSDLPWYRGVSSREDTADSLHHCPNSVCIDIQPTTRILSAHDLEKGLNGTRYICETELLDEVALVISNGEFASPVNHISKNANGSIITLTLKNNHLIVETEERTVSMEDNSFVVEMEPNHARSDIDINTRSMNGIVRSDADQQALVHQEEVAECSTEFEMTKLFGSINTGLSQSDLSISSHGSINRGYRYGNQVEYEAGQFSRSLTPYINNYNDTMSRKLGGIFEKTPDAGDTLRSEMKSSDCDKNTNNDKKHNNSHSSFNTSVFMEYQEWENANNPIDILRPDRNWYMNGETQNELERVMPESLTDECDTCKCNKPMITGALHKDETRETTKPQDIQQFKQPELLQRSKNVDNVSLILGQKFAKPREQKLDRSEFVPSHTRSRSITSRLIENNVEMARTKGTEVYNQLETSLVPDLGSKFESLHNEAGSIESGGGS